MMILNKKYFNKQNIKNKIKTKIKKKLKINKNFINTFLIMMVFIWLIMYKKSILNNFNN